MTPLIVLTAVTGGALGVTSLRGSDRRPNIAIALRSGVAAMFLVTGVSHFAGMRERMIAMVPDELPAPEVIVTATGLLEIGAATAMLSRRLTPWSAAGLTALLVAMFPANVTLAQSGQDLSWSQTLVPRSVIQVLFVAAAGTLAVLGFQRRP